MKYFKIVLLLLVITSIIFISKKLSESKEQASPNESKLVTIELQEGKSESELAFNLDNMLPGDERQEEIRLKVTHKEQVKLMLQFVKKTHEPSHLEQVLRVTITNDGNTLFDGTIQELMEQPIEITLQPNKNHKSDVHYTMKVYLPIETSNDYQTSKLSGEFIWVAEGTLVKKYNVPNTIWILSGSLMGAYLIYLVIKRKGGVKHAL